MGKRIVYSYFYHDERRLVVDYLHKKYGWDPVFFHGKEDSKMRKWVNENYPDAILHDSNEMRQSNFSYLGIGSLAPLDADLIAALSKYESNYLSWLQDTTGWNFSFHERRRYYYDVLKYWNTVINNLKPDLFVAYTLPHLPSDYPMYLLCKHYYGIPVLFLNPMPYLDDKYYIIGDSLGHLSSQFDSLYLSRDKLEASDVVKEYLKSLRSSNPQNPKHITNYLQKLDKIQRNRYLDYLQLIKMIIRGTAFKKSTMSFKKNKESWESDASKLTNFEYFFFKKKLAKKNRQLRNFYNNFAKSPNLNKKYIYFAAPYQPEVLSNLCAGAYEDIFLILDMISQAIPNDWMIYYKEHPNTFKEADKGALMRDKDFYRKVNSYENVRIVPFDMNTFTLIDNSQAICTVGGTVGWEAVVRGKPALVYGSLWYQSCNSVFTIKTYEDVCKAIKEILEGFVPDRKDVERYVEAIYRTSEHDLIIVNDFSRNIAKCDNPEYEMERVAKAFYAAYEFYYSDGKRK